jgi:hypothetical protein
MLHRQQLAAGDFAAEREALRESQCDERNRRRHADGRIRRQDADEKRADAHQQEREHEHVATPDAVSEVSAHNAAEGPRDKAHGKRRKGR